MTDHSKTQYKQCLLQRQGTMMVSWIPLKFAKKAKILKLKVDGEWQDGWHVVTEYGQVINEEKRKMLSSQHVAMRKVTDV